MPAGTNFLDIPCVIEYGTHKLNGFILQMNSNGVMVELTSLPYRAGAVVTVHIQFAPEDILVQEGRAIKSYDNFFRKPPDSKREPPSEAKRLSEIHFIKLNEVSRQRIVRYLGRVQALQRQGK